MQRHEAGAFDPAKGSLAMFAFGIARRLRHELRRDERPIPVEAEASHQPGLDERLSLRQAIAALDPQQRDVIELLVDRDLTLPEVALILELPLNTVKSHVHRAKAAMRAALSA
jgi:RNA polymerase sigma-70 factor (ECF subfamily)